MELKRAIELAEEKIAEHGVAYRVEIINSKTKLGHCDSKNRIIALSKPFIEINEEKVILNTILHEIAHALTPLEGHSSKWREACRRIGAIPSRLNKIAVQPKMKYTISCPECDYVGQTNSRFRHYCGRCYGLGKKVILISIKN